ncbi:MAG TPA: site-2 protease family protein [Burkholderiaceae bacterium]|jgi:Zn-dependent protease|nr:site-2 protease family protein [Burkholderiaceae bacterium]
MLKLLALLISSAKFAKIATTAGTMLISVVVYAWIFGWLYAVGFVLLLLAHELGHYVAARRRGLDVGAPTFIPFVGAWIQLKDLPHDAETEAYVGLGGPLLGTVAAVAVYLLADASDSRVWLAVAYSGFVINLFNLIPMAPFDGGRITAVLGPRIWFAGVPILLALFLYWPSPMLLLVALLAAPQLMAAWRHDPTSPAAVAYYGVTPSVRWRYTASYVALAAFLALMSFQVHERVQARL